MPAMCEGSRAAAMLSWSTQGALQRQDPSHCGVRRYQLGLPVRPETRSAVLIRVYSDQPSFHTPSHTGCLTSPLTRLSRTPPHKMCTHLTQLCHTPNHTGCFDFPSYPLCHAPNHTGCVQLPPSYPTLSHTPPHRMFDFPSYPTLSRTQPHRMFTSPSPTLSNRVDQNRMHTLYMVVQLVISLKNTVYTIFGPFLLPN